MFVVARRGKREKFPCKASFAAKFSTHFPFTPSSDKKTASRENSHRWWQKTVIYYLFTIFFALFRFKIINLNKTNYHEILKA